MKFLTPILATLSLVACSENNSTPHTEWEQGQEQDTTTNTNTGMKITVGNKTFRATLATGVAGAAFGSMLPITLTMSDLNRNEKHASLPRNLPTAAVGVGTIHSGDIMLFGSNTLVLFYASFSTPYSYTKIGRIDNLTGLQSALGSSRATLKFERQLD